jgi:voltage-gated potassium channel
VIISGVGIFGMISGLITSIITEPSKIEKRKKEQEDRHHRDERLELLLQQQAEILKKLDQIDNKKEK